MKGEGRREKVERRKEEKEGKELKKEESAHTREKASMCIRSMAVTMAFSKKKTRREERKEMTAGS